MSQECWCQDSQWCFAALPEDLESGTSPPKNKNPPQKNDKQDNLRFKKRHREKYLLQIYWKKMFIPSLGCCFYSRWRCFSPDHRPWCRDGWPESKAPWGFSEVCHPFLHHPPSGSSSLTSPGKENKVTWTLQHEFTSEKTTAGLYSWYGDGAGREEVKLGSADEDWCTVMKVFDLIKCYWHQCWVKM